MADAIDTVTSFNVSNWLQNAVNQYTPYIIYGIIGILVFGFIFIKMRERKIYTFHVRVLRRRENNKTKESNYKGGYIKSKDGLQKFAIKTGRMPWQKTVLDRLPDAHYIDEENRVYYNQIDPDTYIQVRKIFMEKQMPKRKLRVIQPYAGFKVGQEGEALQEVAEQLVKSGYAEYADGGEYKSVTISDTLYEPIPTDTKQIIISKLQNARSALGIDATKQVAIFTIGLIILAIAFLVAYYFLTNRGG